MNELQPVSKLGRIISVSMGFGGKYNSEFGLWLTMGATKHNGQEDSEWGTVVFKGISRLPHTPESVIKSAEYTAWLISLLDKSNKDEITSLVGVPVICQFQENTLIQWEIWENTV